MVWYHGDKASGDTWKAGYYHDRDWITGTTDYSSVSGNTLSIDDLKTGRWPVLAECNPQLRTYAVPFWLEAGAKLTCEVALSITQWPRYPLDGLPVRNWGHDSGLDMELHLQDLVWALDHPQESEASIENCRFCECQNNCPTFMLSGINFSRS